MPRGDDYLNTPDFSFNWKGCGIFLIVIAVIVVVTAEWWNPLRFQSSIEITVDRLGLESGNDKYLVWTKEPGEVFENTDNWLAGKTNSSDYQGRLQPGHTYRVTVAGWRKPWLSSYRNIISIDGEVDRGPKPLPKPQPVRASQAQNRAPASIKHSTPQKRYCSQCGIPVRNKDKFCSNCGQRL